MKPFILLLAYLFPIISFSQQRYIVSGTVVGTKDSTKVYLSPGLNDAYIDSTIIIQSKFSFKGKVAHPMAYEIIIPKKGEEDDPYGCWFWLENAPITIEGDLENFKHAKITGSVSQLSYERYNREVTMVAEEKNSESLDTVLALTEKFIRKYPGSFKSMEELYINRQLLPFEIVKKLYAKMSAPVQQSWYGKETSSFIKNYNGLKQGDQVPDFAFSDLSGKQFSLRSLRGKHVLLIFWASWCAPCMANNPYYNQIDNWKDSTKLVVLGIGLEKKEALLAAIQKDSVKWRNMALQMNEEYDYYAHPLLYKLGVWSVPHNMLIDPEGKLVTTDKTPFFKRKSVSVEGGAVQTSTIWGELNTILERLYLINQPKF